MAHITVLIVDDEKQVLNSLCRSLKDEAYNVLTATSGHEALDIIKADNINVVLTDLLMPEMDGLMLLKKIETLNPDIVRLVLSGSSDSNKILDAINCGNIYRYILKPWNDMELKLLLRQAIHIYTLKKEKEELLNKLEKHNTMLEKRVQDRTHQLLEAEKMAMIGKHTSQIVHNLNNVLTNLFGLFFLISENIDGQDINITKLKENCRDGIYCLEKMHGIITGILNHARDKTQFNTRQVDINNIIRDEDLFFTMDYDYKYNIKRSLLLHENLPLIKGNPSQIKQIIDNLIKNAIDAMENTKEKKLTIQTSCKNHAVLIEITDTGEGIENKHLIRIFNSDYTTKPVGKGTGLGLASVKSMVESYGGEITVSSEKRKGTTFRVMLPGMKTT